MQGELSFDADRHKVPARNENREAGVPKSLKLLGPRDRRMITPAPNSNHEDWTIRAACIQQGSHEYHCITHNLSESIELRPDSRAEAPSLCAEAAQPGELLGGCLRSAETEPKMWSFLLSAAPGLAIVQHLGDELAQWPRREVLGNGVPRPSERGAEDKRRTDCRRRGQASTKIPCSLTF